MCAAKSCGIFSGHADPNKGAAIAGVWRSFLFAALTGGVLWAVATGKIALRGAIYTLTALVAIDLWSIERNYWLFSPRASVLFASDGAIDAIKADITKTGRRRACSTARSDGRRD